jgi:hypothetical protein
MNGWMAPKSKRDGIQEIDRPIRVTFTCRALLPLATRRALCVRTAWDERAASRYGFGLVWQRHVPVFFEWMGYKYNKHP